MIDLLVFMKHLKVTEDCTEKLSNRLVKEDLSFEQLWEDDIRVLLQEGGKLIIKEI